jgi:hypothetical protein
MVHVAEDIKPLTPCLLRGRAIRDRFMGVAEPDHAARQAHPVTALLPQADRPQESLQRAGRFARRQLRPAQAVQRNRNIDGMSVLGGHGHCVTSGVNRQGVIAQLGVHDGDDRQQRRLATVIASLAADGKRLPSVPKTLGDAAGSEQAESYLPVRALLTDRKPRASLIFLTS